MATKAELGTQFDLDAPKKVRLAAALDFPIFAHKELCRRSFYYFLEYFWSSVSNDAFSPNWHIRYLCQQLQKVAENLGEKKPRLYDIVINVPPGTTKTMTCSIMFPAWCWTRWYWMRFITASYSAALSLESAEYSRDLVRSDAFQEMYPELQIKSDKDNKGNFRITRTSYNNIVRFGGNRYSTSVGATVMGFHGHFLIADDPLNPTQAASEKELKTANDWVGQTLSTRKVDKRVSCTILIQQRLHQKDPTGTLLEQRPETIKHICLPGETQSYREQVKPPGLVKYYKDNLLDPVRMPWFVLENMKKELGQYGYAGQVGQKPVPPGGGMFKVDNFQIVDNTDHLLKSHQIVKCVRYWDKAGTSGGGSATVGVKMYKIDTGFNGIKYLITSVVRGFWAGEKREQVIRLTAEADGVQVTIYHEQEPGSGGKDSAAATNRNLRGYVAYADRPTGDKVTRADPYSVQVNEGVVLLARGEWNKEFIDEHTFFPFSQYKDQVDAASGAFTKIEDSQQAGAW